MLLRLYVRASSFGANMIVRLLQDALGGLLQRISISRKRTYEPIEDTK